MQALQVNEFTHVDFNQTIDANGVNVTVSWWVIYNFILYQFIKGIILAYQEIHFWRLFLQNNWLIAITNLKQKMLSKSDQLKLYHMYAH